MAILVENRKFSHPVDFTSRGSFWSFVTALWLIKLWCPYHCPYQTLERVWRYMHLFRYKYNKISPVGDWRLTSLEWPWPWPWFRPYGIPSCISHRPLPTYQISLRLEEKFFWKSPLRFWSSSESRDTKTRINIKNPVQSNLDIVL